MTLPGTKSEDRLREFIRQNLAQNKNPDSELVLARDGRRYSNVNSAHPLTRSNVTAHDRLWESINSQPGDSNRDVKPNLSPPLQSLHDRAVSGGGLFHHFSDSENESFSSQDTMILTTTEESLRVRQSMERNAREPQGNKTKPWQAPNVNNTVAMRPWLPPDVINASEMKPRPSRDVNTSQEMKPWLLGRVSNDTNTRTWLPPHVDNVSEVQKPWQPSDVNNLVRTSNVTDISVDDIGKSHPLQQSNFSPVVFKPPKPKNSPKRSKTRTYFSVEFSSATDDGQAMPDELPNDMKHVRFHDNSLESVSSGSSTVYGDEDNMSASASPQSASFHAASGCPNVSVPVRVPSESPKGIGPTQTESPTSSSIPAARLSAVHSPRIRFSLDEFDDGYGSTDNLSSETNSSTNSSVKVLGQNQGSQDVTMRNSSLPQKIPKANTVGESSRVDHDVSTRSKTKSNVFSQIAASVKEHVKTNNHRTHTGESNVQQKLQQLCVVDDDVGQSRPVVATTEASTPPAPPTKPRTVLKSAQPNRPSHIQIGHYNVREARLMFDPDKKSSTINVDSDSLETASNYGDYSTTNNYENVDDMRVFDPRTIEFPTNDHERNNPDINTLNYHSTIVRQRLRSQPSSPLSNTPSHPITVRQRIHSQPNSPCRVVDHSNPSDYANYSDYSNNSNYSNYSTPAMRSPTRTPLRRHESLNLPMTPTRRRHFSDDGVLNGSPLETGSAKVLLQKQKVRLEEEQRRHRELLSRLRDVDHNQLQRQHQQQHQQETRRGTDYGNVSPNRYHSRQRGFTDILSPVNTQGQGEQGNLSTDHPVQGSPPHTLRHQRQYSPQQQHQQQQQQQQHQQRHQQHPHNKPPLPPTRTPRQASRARCTSMTTYDHHGQHTKQSRHHAIRQVPPPTDASHVIARSSSPSPSTSSSSAAVLPRPSTPVTYAKSSDICKMMEGSIRPPSRCSVASSLAGNDDGSDTDTESLL